MDNVDDFLRIIDEDRRCNSSTLTTTTTTTIDANIPTLSDSTLAPDAVSNKKRMRDNDEDSNCSPPLKSVSQTTAPKSKVRKVVRRNELHGQFVSASESFEIEYRFLCSEHIGTQITSSYEYMFKVESERRRYYDDNILQLVKRMFLHAKEICGKLYRYQKALIKWAIIASLDSMTTNETIKAQVRKELKVTDTVKALILQLARRSGKSFALEVMATILISMLPYTAIGYYSIKIDQAVPVLRGVSTRVGEDSYGCKLKVKENKRSAKVWYGDAGPGDERSIIAVSGQKHSKDV